MIQLILIATVTLLSTSFSFGQEQSSVKWQDRRWGLPARPENCETNASNLAQVREMVRDPENQQSLLILIARLGDDERGQRLNHRRLYNVRLKLITELDIPTERMIIAEGERVNGFGRVEFYLRGELIGALPVPKARDICVGCCDPDERFYPYKRKDRASKEIMSPMFLVTILQ